MSHISHGYVRSISTSPLFSGNDLIQNPKKVETKEITINLTIILPTTTAVHG